MATFSIFLLTWEVSESSGAAVCAALVMSIIPAHLMRSMTGCGDFMGRRVELLFFLKQRCHVKLKYFFLNVPRPERTMDLRGAVFFLAQTIRKCMLRLDCVLNEGCFLFQGFWFEI